LIFIVITFAHCSEQTDEERFHHVLRQLHFPAELKQFDLQPDSTFPVHILQEPAIPKFHHTLRKMDDSLYHLDNLMRIAAELKKQEFIKTELVVRHQSLDKAQQQKQLAKVLSAKKSVRDNKTTPTNLFNLIFSCFYLKIFTTVFFYNFFCINNE